MKKKYLSLICLLFLLLLSGCGDPLADGIQIALIPGNGDVSQWTALETGARRAAAELELQAQMLTPNTREGDWQARLIREARKGKYDAIVISPDGSAETAEAMAELSDKGMKLIAVDPVGTVEADVVYSTDQQALGRAAGEAMISALKAKKVSSGTIGIISPGLEGEEAAQREAGFRAAFRGSGHRLLSTRHDGGEMTVSGILASDYIRQDVDGIYGCTEGAAISAAAAAQRTQARAVVMGHGQPVQGQELREAGFLRTVIGPDYGMAGYESIISAAALLKGEETPREKTIAIQSVDSEAPLLRVKDLRIALITPGKRDQRWTLLREGVLQEAETLGCQAADLSPLFSSGRYQAECILEAVEQGYHGIITIPVQDEEVLKALEAAAQKQVAVICVDGSGAVEAAASFVMDHGSAGQTAGTLLKKMLEEQGILEGSIAVIAADGEDEEARVRESGFREALEGSPYTLVQTRYSEGDAAKAHTIAEELIRQNVAGIFCCDEGSTLGAGNATQAVWGKTAVVVGFGDSAAVRKQLEEGRVAAILVSSSQSLGREALNAACGYLTGKEAAGKTVHMNVSAVTAED